MFRFEEHMPEYWENESRDFQLLTRIDDLIFMGQRADIATIQNLNSSKKCKNIFLPLLAKKVGFFTNKQIEDNVLRNIIGAFRLAVKHKGSELGIRYAVTAILKAEKSVGTPEIKINEFGDNSINIYTPINIVNKVALKEFLKYIVPTGYTINIYSYVSDLDPAITKLSGLDQVKWRRAHSANIGAIKSFNELNPSRDISGGDYLAHTYYGSVAAGQIISLDDYKYSKNGTSIEEKELAVITSNKDKNNGVVIGD